MIQLISILASGIVDSDGEPLASGTVRFYEANGSTLKTVFQDYELTNPHSNPATLDAAGRLTAYVDGKCKLVAIGAAGTPIIRVDGVGIGEGDLESGDFVEGSVTTAKFADGAVTESKIVSNSVTTGKLSSVGTNAFASGAVTPAKREALGQQISSSCAGFTTSSTSPTDVTNLSVTITATGRPVRLMLIGNGTNACGVGNVAGGIVISFVRDATTLTLHEHARTTAANSFYLPPGSFDHIDVDATAGSHTYKVQAKRTAVAVVTVEVTHCRLLAYEL